MERSRTSLKKKKEREKRKKVIGRPSSMVRSKLIFPRHARIVAVSGTWSVNISCAFTISFCGRCTSYASSIFLFFFPLLLFFFTCRVQLRTVYNHEFQWDRLFSRYSIPRNQLRCFFRNVLLGRNTGWLDHRLR